MGNSPVKSCLSFAKEETRCDDENMQIRSDESSDRADSASIAPATAASAAASSVTSTAPSNIHAEEETSTASLAVAATVAAAAAAAAAASKNNSGLTKNPELVYLPFHISDVSESLRSSSPISPSRCKADGAKDEEKSPIWRRTEVLCVAVM